MKKYTCFFRIRFINNLQYRAAAWAGIATQFVWGFMYILLFWILYQNGENNFPMTFAQFSNYIWLQQAFLTLYMSWYFDGEVLESISTGSIAYELCRPIDIYNLWFVKNMAVRTSKAVLRCFPIIIVSALLPYPFNLSLPISFSALLLFVLSSFIGFLCLVAFSMLIYISAFYTVSTKGIIMLAITVLDFFSGSLIPLPFFPDNLQTVMNILPFASITNTPFLIYSGNMTGTESIYSVLLQIFWTFALIALGKYLMKNAVKKVVSQGG